jgi:integrase/recombinase XerD
MAKRKLPKTLSRDEAEALLARANLAAPTGLRNRCMLELMYRSGLRVSEVCGLNLRDWRAQDGQIHLRPEVAKGGHEGFAYVAPETEQLLRRWKTVRRQFAAGRPQLFTTLPGTRVSRHYVWEMVDRYARRAGLERHVNPHMLRHTFATELLRERFSIREVQTLMRHADVRTTTIYLEVVDADLQERVRARTR